MCGSYYKILTFFLISVIYYTHCINVDMENKYLWKISSDTFKDHDAKQIEQMNLRLCAIKFINENSFIHMTKLSNLNLAQNVLSDLPEKVFVQTTNLQKLYLFDNKIEYLPKNIFAKLKLLTEVDLSYNSIRVLDPNIFQHNLKLKEIYLQANKLQYIDPTIIFNLKVVTRIKLHDNPWNCDKQFKNVLKTIDKLISTTSFFLMPHCVAPLALAGRQWDTLKDSDFSSVQLEISPDVSTHYAEEGDNVKFSCRVSGQHNSNFTHLKWTRETNIDFKNSRLSTEKYLKSGSMVYNLLIADVQKQDGGIYKCIYQDKQEREERQINLYFYEVDTNVDLNNGNVTLSLEYESNYYSKTDRHIRLPCLVTQHPDTNISWAFKDKNINDLSGSDNHYKTALSVSTNVTVWYNLTIFNLKLADSGSYKCESSYKYVRKGKPVVYKNVNIVHLFIEK